MGNGSLLKEPRNAPGTPVNGHWRPITHCPCSPQTIAHCTSLCYVHDSTQSMSLCFRRTICMTHRFFPPPFLSTQKPLKPHTFYWAVLLPGVKWLVVPGISVGFSEYQYKRLRSEWTWHRSVLAFSQGSSLSARLTSPAKFCCSE